MLFEHDIVCSPETMKAAYIKKLMKVIKIIRKSWAEEAESSKLIKIKLEPEMVVSKLIKY